MAVSGTNSLIKVLKTTNHYLLAAIVFFFFSIAAALAVILFQSNQTVCELFNSKIESTGSSIARELALGEKGVANSLFEKVTTSLEKVSPEVRLALVDGKDEVRGNSCVAGIFTSEISHQLSFSGENVGFIVGTVKPFKTERLITLVLILILLMASLLNFIKNKLLENIKSQIVIPIEKLCGQEEISQENLPSEVKLISDKLSKLKESIIIAETARIELAQAEKISKVATQVAHDIRSPLEMFKGLKDELSLLPESSRRRIQLGINRIEEITFNLLKNHKVSSKVYTVHKSEEILSILEGILTEKSIEFRGCEKILIEESFNPHSYGLFSLIDRGNLKSIISNLINNSVDAFEGNAGRVSLRLYSKDNQNIIEILDNGSGISEDLAMNLFTKGFTTKKNGNGLGLYNAKQDIEAAGGTLTFTTDLGKGTTFTITLPKSEAPSTFIDAILTEKYERIIVLDDDPAFHEVWSKRLEGLESKVEHIYSVKEMFSKYQALHPKILLLSDFELMDNEFDGIDIIQKFQHADHSVLVTARFEEQAIQDRCFENGIKLLPKSLVNYVKVIKSQSEHSSLNLFESAAEKSSFYPKGEEAGIESKKSPIVLIDDDKFVHINWSLICKKIGLDLHVFYSIDDFLKLAHTFDKGTRIYIDSHLGDGIQGEFESEQIFNLGFDNLFLTTGYQKEDINKPSWIKEIYSKGPDCLSEYYA